jgi:hypothetical protein
MQPYFIPYLGYWQIMNAVDIYVVYDDVNYIKGGRINRNAILLNNQAHNINLILNGASPNKLINEVTVNDNEVNRRKLRTTITQSYSKAPYFNDVFPLINEIFSQEETNLAKYLYHSFEIIKAYLGIDTKLIYSSEIPKDNKLTKQDKLFDICRILGADEYYNSINGMPLYAHLYDQFSSRGIRLRFPTMNSDICYKQFKNEFVPNLSIIDVMMFNSKEECQRLLSAYSFADVIEYLNKAEKERKENENEN